MAPYSTIRNEGLSRHASCITLDALGTFKDNICSTNSVQKAIDCRATDAAEVIPAVKSRFSEIFWMFAELRIQGNAQRNDTIRLGHAR